MVVDTAGPTLYDTFILSLSSFRLLSPSSCICYKDSFPLRPCVSQVVCNLSYPKLLSTIWTEEMAEWEAVAAGGGWTGSAHPRMKGKGGWGAFTEKTPPRIPDARKCGYPPCECRSRRGSEDKPSSRSHRRSKSRSRSPRGRRRRDGSRSRSRSRSQSRGGRDRKSDRDRHKSSSKGGERSSRR